MSIDKEALSWLHKTMEEEIEETKASLKQAQAEGDKKGVETFKKVLEISYQGLKYLEQGDFDNEWAPFFLSLLKERRERTQLPEKYIIPQNEILHEIARLMHSKLDTKSKENRSFGYNGGKKSKVSVIFRNPMTKTGKPSEITEGYVKKAHQLLVMWSHYFLMSKQSRFDMPQSDYIALTGATSEESARRSFEKIRDILHSARIKIITKNSQSKKLTDEEMVIFSRSTWNYESKTISFYGSEWMVKMMVPSKPTMTLPLQYTQIDTNRHRYANAIIYKLAYHLAVNGKNKISVRALCDFAGIPTKEHINKHGRDHTGRRRCPFEDNINAITSLTWKYDKEITNSKDFENAYIIFNL